MDNYDLKQEGPMGEGVLKVLEYQQNKRAQKKVVNNLYVKNFGNDPDFTDQQLAEIFKPYGEVDQACVMRDENGRSKGFGFVSFKDPEDAPRAIRGLMSSDNQEGL